ncbi:hypothetical protein ACLOJK_000181 [Asimina triloba]
MAIHVGRGVMACTRGCLRLICNHVFVVVIALVSVVAYRFVPPTISSYVLSSPLIVCPALLLAILFSFGLRRVPEPQEQRPHHTHDDHLHLPNKPSSNSESGGLTAAASSGIDLGSDGDDVEDDDAENQEEEEEEAQEEEEDGTEAVVSWTADDEKNLIDLGTSELERNQRVENLLAKRIASKKQRAAAAEKNLIDLDTHDPLPAPTPTPAVDHFPHMQIHVPPPAFRTKNNPFDLPYSPIPGLPPIPGSAPSVLLPRRNPFDLPYVPPQAGHPNPNPPNPMSLTPTLAHARFEPMPPRHLFFRRHESFTLGGSTPMEIKHHQQQQMMPQSSSSSNLKPYFVAERVAANEDAHLSLQRQMSGGSDSKLSSVVDSDTSSSVVDELDAEDHEKLNQLELNIRAEEPNSFVEQEENDSSDGVDSMETHPDNSHVDDILVQETSSNASDDIHGMHGDGSSSSWSMQLSTSEKMIFKTGDNEPSSSGQVALSTATLAPVRVVREPLASIDYGPVKEPVYDSSPSAAAKTSSNVSSIAGDLFPIVEEGVSESTSCAVSEPMPVERTIPFDLEGESKRISSAKKQWVASTSLSFVDRNESRSRGVSEVREADVIQAVLESSTEATPLEIHFVHPESTVDGMTDTTSSEESGISIEESAARTSCEGDHQETQRKHIDEASNDNLETKEITQSSTTLERSLLEKKSSDETSKDDKGVKEITQSSTTLEIEPIDLGDKSAFELVDANALAVNKHLDDSNEVTVKELVKEIDEALQANEEIMKSAILKSIQEKAMSTDAQVGVTGIGLAQESQVGSSAAWTDKHQLEPPAEIHSDVRALEATSPKDIHLDLKQQKSIASDDGPVEDEECERPPEPESLIQTRSGSEGEAAIKKSAAEVEAAAKKLMLDDKNIITAIEADADNNKESIKAIPPEPLIHTESAAEVEAAVKKPMPDDKSITAIEPAAANNKESIKENSSTQESKIEQVQLE